MTLRQLALLQAIVDNDYNLSAAAKACHTSQPGASRQIALLEHELGVRLLVRRKNRILNVTAVGHDIVAIARGMMTQAENIRLVAADERGDGGGRLVVATSHLHARYTLRHPTKVFSRKHPDVELHLLQADPEDIVNLVENGTAHVGMSTLPTLGHPSLLLLQSAQMRRSVIMPVGHPLARKRRIALTDLARHPIVGYHARSTAGRQLRSAFEAQGLAPRFVVSANDSDVIKTYVAEGLGVAIVPTMSIRDTEESLDIVAVDATALFPATFMTICLRRDKHFRHYLTDFVALCAPQWTRRAVLRQLAEVNDRGTAGIRGDDAKSSKLGVR